PPSVRFRYLYSDDELAEWEPKVRALAGEAQEVHAVMNNNYSDYSVRNARRLAELLEQNGAQVSSPLGGEVSSQGDDGGAGQVSFPLGGEVSSQGDDGGAA